MIATNPSSTCSSFTLQYTYAVQMLLELPSDSDRRQLLPEAFTPASEGAPDDPVGTMTIAAMLNFGHGLSGHDLLNLGADMLIPLAHMLLAWSLLSSTVVLHASAISAEAELVMWEASITAQWLNTSCACRMLQRIFCPPRLYASCRCGTLLLAHSTCQVCGQFVPYVSSFTG